MTATPPPKKTSPIMWFLAISLFTLVAAVIAAGIITGELNLTTTVTLLMVPVGTVVAAVAVTGRGKDE